MAQEARRIPRNGIQNSVFSTVKNTDQNAKIAIAARSFPAMAANELRI